MFLLRGSQPSGSDKELDASRIYIHRKFGVTEMLSVGLQQCKSGIRVSLEHFWARMKWKHLSCTWMGKKNSIQMKVKLSKMSELFPGTENSICVRRMTSKSSISAFQVALLKAQDNCLLIHNLIKLAFLCRTGRTRPLKSIFSFVKTNPAFVNPSLTPPSSAASV